MFFLFSAPNGDMSCIFVTRLAGVALGPACISNLKGQTQQRFQSLQAFRAGNAMEMQGSLPEVVDSAVGPLRWRFATRMWAGSHDRRMPKAVKLWQVEEIHAEAKETNGFLK